MLTPDPARPGAARCSPRRGPACRPARWTRRWGCWSRPRPGRWTSCSAPRWTCCAGRSRSTSGRGSDAAAAAAQRGPAARAARRRPGARDLPGGARWPRCGPAIWQPGRRCGRPPRPRAPRRPVPTRRGRWISCSTRSRCGSPRATRPAAPALTRRAGAVSRAGRRRRRSRPLALARRRESQQHHRPRAVGRRGLACPGRRPGPVRPRDGRARAPAVRAQLPGQNSACLAGELAAAARLIEEDRRDRGGDREPADRAYTAMMLAAWRGQEREAVRADRGHLAGGHRARRGHGWSASRPTRARSCTTASGQHDAARDAARHGPSSANRWGTGPSCVPELAEAAARTGDAALLRGRAGLAGRTHAA